ncbi:hypothetical protein HHI36_015068 [Cryptolaemus montrouzieri]|uniref:Uncharacterized protein n=1 Tax=Cryptolaemus montrouzieri TaxID=559131 RepID=A0ABD2N508_9CUCU
MGDFSVAQQKYEDKIITLESRNEQLRKELNIVAKKQKENNIITNGLYIGDRALSDAAIQILSFNPLKVESYSAKLKGIGLLISNDLIAEELMQQKILVGRMRAERRLGHTCRLQGPNLVIDGKFYTLEQLEERRKNESGISGAVNDSRKGNRNKPATRSNSN